MTTGNHIADANPLRPTVEIPPDACCANCENVMDDGKCVIEGRRFGCWGCNWRRKEGGYV